MRTCQRICLRASEHIHGGEEQPLESDDPDSSEGLYAVAGAKILATVYDEPLQRDSALCVSDSY
jgi:hypothetical protein